MVWSKMSLKYLLCMRTEPTEKTSSVTVECRGSMCRPKGVGWLSNYAENLIKEKYCSPASMAKWLNMVL